MPNNKDTVVQEISLNWFHVQCYEQLEMLPQGGQCHQPEDIKYERHVRYKTFMKVAYNFHEYLPWMWPEFDGCHALGLTKLENHAPKVSIYNKNKVVASGTDLKKKANLIGRKANLCKERSDKADAKKKSNYSNKFIYLIYLRLVKWK